MGWNEDEGHMPPDSTWVSEERWRDDIALELSVEVEPARVSVRLIGSLDELTMARFRTSLQELLAAGAREVVVFVEGVRFGTGADSTLAGLMASLGPLGVALSLDGRATWRSSVDRSGSIVPIGQDGATGNAGSE